MTQAKISALEELKAEHSKAVAGLNALYGRFDFKFVEISILHERLDASYKQQFDELKQEEANPPKNEAEYVAALRRGRSYDLGNNLVTIFLGRKALGQPVAEAYQATLEQLEFHAAKLKH